jgi:hypothetical protein
MARGEKTGTGIDNQTARSRVSDRGESKEIGEGPGQITRVAGGYKHASNGQGI